VLDASVVIRATVESSTSAREWLEAIEDGAVDAYVPDLIYAEVANSLTLYVGRGDVDADRALELLAGVNELRFRIRSNKSLFGVALAIAVRARLTAYDAHYLALAEAEDAVLVTADRGLAAAASQSVLLE